MVNWGQAFSLSSSGLEVVAVAPVLGQVADEIERDTLRPVVDRLTLRPPGSGSGADGGRRWPRARTGPGTE